MPFESKIILGFFYDIRIAEFLFKFIFDYQFLG